MEYPFNVKPNTFFNPRTNESEEAFLESQISHMWGIRKKSKNYIVDTSKANYYIEKVPFIVNTHTIFNSIDVINRHTDYTPVPLIFGDNYWKVLKKKELEEMHALYNKSSPKLYSIYIIVKTESLLFHQKLMKDYLFCGLPVDIDSSNNVQLYNGIVRNISGVYTWIIDKKNINLFVQKVRAGADVMALLEVYGYKVWISNSGVLEPFIEIDIKNREIPHFKLLKFTDFDKADNFIEKRVKQLIENEQLIQQKLQTKEVEQPMPF